MISIILLGDHNERNIMVLLLVLNLLFGCSLSEVKVFINYTLTFESDDCTRGTFFFIAILHDSYFCF